MTVRAAAILLLALLPAGCGRSEDPERDAAFRGAARTLETYMKALKEGDCRKAYECLSWKRRKEITLAQIEADYAGNRERFHYRAGSAKIEKSFYDSFRVYAMLVNGDGKREFVSLLPEDGAWRIEEKGGSLVDLIHRNQRGGVPHPEDGTGGGP